MALLLPYGKGEAVIQQARRDPVFGNRPIYVCTSASLMDAWTRRGIKAWATKVFNKASTPIDQIIADAAADLMAPELAAYPSAAIPMTLPFPEPLNSTPPRTLRVCSR